MKRFSSALYGLPFLLLSAISSAEETAYPVVEFNQLSDQKLSPEGANALHMDPASWRHAESPNFIFHFTDEKQAQTVLAHSETYFQWIQEMLGKPELSSRRKCQVYIFNDEKIWEEFRHRGTLERITGAEAFTDGNELFIHRVEFWLEPQRVLAHELTHIALYRLLGGRIPMFLNEGYSEYIGYKAIALKFGGDEYSMHTLARVAEKDYQTLEQLAAVRVYPKGLEEMRAFYSESQLFVRFLLERYGTPKFAEFLRSMIQTKSLSFSLHQVYELDQDGVETAFHAYAAASADA